MNRCNTNFPQECYTALTNFLKDLSIDASKNQLNKLTYYQQLVGHFFWKRLPDRSHKCLRDAFLFLA